MPHGLAETLGCDHCGVSTVSIILNRRPFGNATVRNIPKHASRAEHQQALERGKQEHVRRSLSGCALPVWLSNCRDVPELPDVEVFRRVLETTSLNRRIAEVEIFSGKVIKGARPQEFREQLAGQKLSSSLRHGKYLFAGLLCGDHLGMHLGMSGRLEHVGEGEELPRHTRCSLIFDDGRRLAYVSQRQLGKLFWIEDLEDFVRGRQLGPDALDHSLDFQSFSKRVASRRGTVKSTLMDQSFLAGIGNIYSDEVLFQARLVPTRRARVLSQEELARLYKATRQVLQAAIDAGAEPERMPESYLLRCRCPEGRCPRCKTALETVKVGGRRGYFCPACQA